MPIPSGILCIDDPTFNISDLILRTDIEKYPGGIGPDYLAQLSARGNRTLAEVYGWATGISNKGIITLELLLPVHMQKPIRRK